ncbi:DUF4435 domain-containing protein [Bradyrhizobium sp. 41S5]|uniref:DUF4435 domain-containing protein n=1 Tax=Bradyrhizobium sp. 41S5 TaxID=1404443 RepID=UPI00156AE19C|nr:DUF4435 domain-containing protein [Bradyrhizobium sp. 41S5]UFX42102.1 DUF4435 domain-containing protein [Bradyrhizobium sp. 41S5]
MTLPVSQDAYVNKLRAARDRPAVLKTKLASVRSSSPGCLVFAFEGDLDKGAYFQWVKRLRSDLVYEPFPCGGKRQVLEFREMLRRDLGGLAARVYFFIDRDFDDFRGFDPDPATTFATDQYSVENYLVTREVLEELLKDEFHCHAEPEIRNACLAVFDQRLTEFLTATEAINFRLFIARKNGFTLQKHLPTRINNVALVALDSVSPIAVGPEQVVIFNEQVSLEQFDTLKAEFPKLNPQKRYRGKFNLLFFMKWLDLLAADRAAEKSNTSPKSAVPRELIPAGSR